MPQGSILGALADDTTLYVCDKNLNNTMKDLEHDSLIAIEWFNSNYMKLNEDKCHSFVLGHKYEHLLAKIGQSIIWEKNNVKILGMDIDSKLSFDAHVSSLCAKAGRKLTALTRLAKFLMTHQRRILIRAFIESQFNYCRLVWMFHSRKLIRGLISYQKEMNLLLFTIATYKL